MARRSAISAEMRRLPATERTPQVRDHMRTHGARRTRDDLTDAAFERGPLAGGDR